MTTLVNGTLALLAILVASGLSSDTARARAGSAPNGLIAFVEIDGSLGGRIAVANADGTSKRNVGPTSFEGLRLHLSGSPAWSPDGREIAFVAQPCPAEGGRCRPKKLFVMASDGSGLRPIAETEANVPIKPSWSPDGSELALLRGLATFDPWRIDAVRSDGSGSRVIVAPPAGEGLEIRDVHWSPDGRTIAFSRVRIGDARSGIWVVDAAGGEPRLLLGRVAEGVPRPVDWSPGGEQILFTLQPGPDPTRLGGAFTVGRDGSDVRRLFVSTSSDGGGWAAAAWAPDGQSILLSSPNHIGVMPAAPTGGRQDKQILKGRDPDWQRCGGSVPCSFPVPSVALSRLVLRPRQPRAGATLAVTTQLRAAGQIVEATHFLCTARARSRPLLPPERMEGTRTFGCVWKIPRWAKGSRLTIKFTAVVDGRVATGRRVRTASVLVR